MRKHSLTMATMIAPLLMMALAACSSAGAGDGVASGGGKATATATAPVTSDQDLGIKFAKCMRTNGVNMADPDAGKSPVVVDGPEGSKEHTALEACKQFLSGGGVDTKISTADLAKVRDFAKCMRANGVDMPDPDANGGITAKTGGDMAKMEAAEKICQVKLPGQAG